MQQQLKVIVSGGGTGGHIFPALAIANALKEKRPDAEFLFVGANGKMEMEKVPAAGYKIIGLNIAGLQRSLTLKNLLFPFKLLSSWWNAQKIVNEFKPHIAIGTGGYASGPILQVASGKNIPCVIQEQNSFPGITNKLLAKRVNKICVAYSGMEKFFPKEKIVITGNPVRKDILVVNDKRAEAFNVFQLNKDLKTVLIIGGSLGARTINESIEAAIDKLKQNNIQLIWQTGKTFYSQAKKIESNSIKVFDFLSKMDLAYAAADVVVSRAGAISLSELAIVAKPSILVPSPNVAEDHQTKNAMAFQNKNAAIMIKDSESKQKLGDAIVSLVMDEKKQQELSVNIKKLAQPDATEKIVSEILKLLPHATTT